MYVFDLKPIPIFSYTSITINHAYDSTILSTDSHNFICMHHYLCVYQSICYSLSICLSPTPSFFLLVCPSLYLFLPLSLSVTLSFPSSQSVCHSSLPSSQSVCPFIFSFFSVCPSPYLFLPLSLSVSHHFLLLSLSVTHHFLLLSLSVPLSFPSSQSVCHSIFFFLSVCLSLYIFLCHLTHLFFAISARIFSPIVFLNNSIFSTISVRPSDFRSFSRESNFGPNPTEVG